MNKTPARSLLERIRRNSSGKKKAKTALIGAGIGAGIGAIAKYRKSSGDKKETLKGALIGAGAGGAVGYAGHTAAQLAGEYKYRKNVLKGQKEDFQKVRNAVNEVHRNKSNAYIHVIAAELNLKRFKPGSRMHRAAQTVLRRYKEQAKGVRNAAKNTIKKIDESGIYPRSEL